MPLSKRAIAARAVGAISVKKRRQIIPADNRIIPGSRPNANVDSEPATGSDIGQPRDTGSQDPLQLSTGSQDLLQLFTGSGADSESDSNSSGYQSGELSDSDAFALAPKSRAILP